MSETIPRRSRVDLMTPAELAIRAAMHAVEELPPDVRLTDAVVLLGQAQEKVADFVDTTFTCWRCGKTWPLTSKSEGFCCQRCAHFER